MNEEKQDFLKLPEILREVDKPTVVQESLI